MLAPYVHNYSTIKILPQGYNFNTSLTKVFGRGVANTWFPISLKLIR